MILSVGEILVDRINNDGKVTSHVGGAPFNVAVNAYRQGAEVLFFGAVGKDSDGDFLVREAEKYLPKGCLIERVNRPTTVASVTLDNGERRFSFLRDDAADYAFDKLPPLNVSGLNIVHLGTLMLNKPEGMDFAKRLFDECEKKNLILSVDANFRDDLFETKGKRNAAIIPFLKRADIIKLSDDELKDLTGEEDIRAGMEKFNPKKLMFVTCGKAGSAAYEKNLGYIFCKGTPAEKVVDTTGAGDAFYGAVLAKLDKTPSLDIDALTDIMAVGNEAGKATTQKEGAV